MRQLNKKLNTKTNIVVVPMCIIYDDTAIIHKFTYNYIFNLHALYHFSNHSQNIFKELTITSYTFLFIQNFINEPSFISQIIIYQLIINSMMFIKLKFKTAIRSLD